MTTALSAAAATPALAVMPSWINPGTGDWFDPDNWNIASVPNSFTSVLIDNGGTAQVMNGGDAMSYDVFLGAGPADSGTVEVTGAGSSWAIDNRLFVGDNGTGTITISGGGEVSVGADSFIGAISGSTGLVVVTGAGSSLSLTGLLTVAGEGSGTLTISNGGTVDAVSGAFVGENAGGVGVVTVDGAGSSFTASELRVGDSGDGTLNITNGGQVTSGYGGIGYYAGSTGVVTVSGAGSTWTNDGNNDLVIGNLGEGTLTIADGGTVHSTGNAFIAGDVGGVGIVTVDGSGSSWTVDDDLHVGAFGSGTLKITNGGQVTSGEARIGDLWEDGAGTVIVDGAGSTWTNWDHMYLGTVGSGTLRISNGGAVNNDDDLDIGPQGTLIIGAAANQAPGAAGTFDADQIIFHDGTGTATLIFNHNDADYSFSVPMNGVGMIWQKGTGTTVLTGDSSGFNGSTYVDAGRLIVDGTLGGETYVAATLGGSGTIGETQLSYGGIIAPGHDSIGTLTVDGNLWLNANSTYAAEFEGGSNDLIAVTGDAHLANSELKLSGHPALLSPYTILTSGGAIYDTFGTINADYAFISPALSYDSDSVEVEFDRNSVAFADIAASPSQASVAAAVEALGAGNTLYDSVLGLNEAEAQDAFDQLAGGPSTTQAADIQTAGLVSNILTGRIDQAFDAVGDSGPRVNNHAQNAPGFVTDPGAPTNGVWGQFYGAYGSVASGGGVAGTQSVTGGLALGLDGQLGTWQVGVVVQGGATSAAVPDLNATSTSADYGAGLYAGTEFGDTRLSLGATYTRHSVSSTRHVVFPGVDETLTGAYGSGTAQGFAQVSHEFDLGATSLTPYASLQYVANGSDGYTETRGAAALTVAPNLIDATFTTLGVSASQQFVVGDDKLLTANGGLGWRHSFAATPSAVHSLAGGTSFSVLGAPMASDIAVLSAGLSLDLSDATTFNLSYDGQLGAGVQTHGLTATWNSKF